MSEKITCPYCEGTFDVDMMETNALWRDRARIAARLGKVWHLANEYLDAFRLKPLGRLTLKRRMRHLASLAKLWESGVFEHDGKRYRCSQVLIQEALTKVCELEKIGFKDHNYLKAILLKGASRVSAEGLTAKEERDREEKKRHPEHGARHAAAGEDRPMSPEEYKKQKGVESLADMVGKVPA